MPRVRSSPRGRPDKGRHELGVAPADQAAIFASHRLWVLVLLVIGLALWLITGNDMPLLRWIVVLAAVALSLMPMINRRLGTWIGRLAHVSPSRMRILGVVAGTVAAIYLCATAFIQDRDLFPKMQDECSYVLGARMLAGGHLWMPMHPLADFFDAFNILVRPVYCSAYFPGTALIFAPMFWLHLPSWVLPVIVSGAIGALLCLILGELLDGVAALLAVVWLVSLAEFRGLSVMVMSHLPMLLLGLLMIWAWLRWRQGQRPIWVLLLGIAGGWAAITRPADAVAYAIPVGIAVIAGLWKQPPKKWAATLACLAAGAAPFLALQVVFDKGVTGHALQTPFNYSMHLDQPGAEFGFRQYDPSLRPASSFPQKVAYFQWTRQFIQEHRFPHVLARWFVPEERGGGLKDPRLLIVANAILPSRVLLVLVPLGLLSLTDRRRLVLAAVLPSFLFVYLFYAYFFTHYCVIVAPAMMLLVLAGARTLASAWPQSALDLRVPLAVFVLALCVTSLWEVKQIFPRPADEPPQDGMNESTPMAVILRELPKHVTPPAVVLFRPNADFFQEPVYNFQAPWPDDCPIIRAHDLGPRDGEIIRYYADRQPDRVFYACNPNALTVERLGTARELLAKFRPVPAESQGASSTNQARERKPVDISGEAGRISAHRSPPKH